MKKILFALTMLVIFPAALADDEVRQHDLFRLCTTQEKIDLIFGDIDEDAIAAGLTRDRIENVVESRLRAARIFDTAEVDYLLVSVIAFQPKLASGQPIGDGKTLAVASNLSFQKVVHDSDTNLLGVASTLTYQKVLMGKADYIVQILSEDVDRFINEFLRVNESEECRNVTGKDSE